MERNKSVFLMKKKEMRESEIGKLLIVSRI